MNDRPILGPKVERSFELVGKRWTGLILYVLLSGPKRFSEIHTLIPSLSKRMLTERIKELEEHNIIERQVITDRPVRVEYLLTEKGKELGGILGNIGKWGENWMTTDGEK